MLRVNPATALRMLRDFVPLAPGSWIVQNAANSAVGRAVIRIARASGWRTVNMVRRPELVEELLREGGDVVLVEDDTLPEKIREVVAGAPLPLALNAVGGESAVRLAEALDPEGSLVTCGAMGRKPVRIPNGLLIFKDLRWRGFWVTRWYQRASPEAQAAMFAELFAWTRSGVIHSPIEQVYELEQITAALERAQQGHRNGKIVLRCG
jgi:mitochondrial enoyl-[acyl-carrier protein] reductase / trans-2-enoyl-CoA reductase